MFQRNHAILQPKIEPDIIYTVNKLAKYAYNPGIPHYYQELLHLIGFIKGNSNKVLKFYQDIFKSQFFSVLRVNNIKVSKGLIIPFTDSYWNDYMHNIQRNTAISQVW